MPVFVTLRVGADPATFAEQSVVHAEAIGRIMEVAKSKGLIGHRWVGGDGEVMAIDEWPDAESFQQFFAEAEADIGPFMQAAGVTSPPEVTVWSAVDIDDAFGWGA